MPVFRAVIGFVGVAVVVAAAGCTRDKACTKLQGSLRGLAQVELEQTLATFPRDSDADSDSAELQAATRRSIDRAIEASVDRCVALPDEAFECVAPLSAALPTYLAQMGRCGPDDHECRRKAGARAKDWIRAPCQTVLRQVYCRDTDIECAKRTASDDA